MRIFLYSNVCTSLLSTLYSLYINDYKQGIMIIKQRAFKIQNWRVVRDKVKALRGLGIKT